MKCTKNQVHTCIYSCKHIYYIYIYMRVYTCTYIRTYIQTSFLTKCTKHHINIYYTYVYIHLHTYTYIYTYQPPHEVRQTPRISTLYLHQQKQSLSHWDSSTRPTRPLHVPMRFRSAPLRLRLSAGVCVCVR